MVGCMLAVVLLFSNSQSVHAEVDQVEVVITEDMDDVVLSPGQTTHVKVPVLCATKEYTMNNTRATVKFASENGEASSVNAFRIKNITFSRPHSTDISNTIPYAGEPTIIEFDIVSLETVKEGQYRVDMVFQSKYGAFISNTVSIPCVVREELSPATIAIHDFTYAKENAKPGKDLKLELRVKNEGDMYASGAALKLECIKEGEGNIDIKPSYAANKLKIGSLKPGETAKVTVPVKILKSATNGQKLLKFTFTYKDAEGKEQSNVNEDYNVDVQVNKKEIKEPAISFTNAELRGELKAGKKFNAVVTLKNTGKAKAENIKVSVTDGIAADGVVADFSGSNIPVKSLNAGESTTVTIPLAISKEAAKGTKSIKIVAVWKDTDGSSKDTSGVEYTDFTVISPSIQASKEKKKGEGVPNIVIRNVEQNPACPEADSQVIMSFEVANLSKVDANELKIGTTGLTAQTFSPMTSDPYIYIDQLKGGKSKTLTMSFKLSKEIPEGFGTIPLSYSFKHGENDTEVTGTANLNVLNIVNELGDLSKSVPKLIVSHFAATPEAPKAGQSFTFDYDIQNTHTSVAAKNIKVTIAQAENIFSVTSGSNSFYIDKIAAGETKNCSIELKVKSDATTKAYPLTVTMSYEYDGAAANPQTGKIGEEVTETINLQAVENTRAEVENIYMDEWNTPTVGQPGTLYFVFYNMGKSPLNNVCVTVDGDFEKSDGEKQIIGTVNAGEVENIEMEITPLHEGESTAVLHFTYEDSNGEQIGFDKEFKTTIMSDVPQDPGFDPMGPMEPMDEAKKPIVPLWAFVLIQVAILVVVTPVTRKIKITRYKKKLEKAEEEN